MRLIGQKDAQRNIKNRSAPELIGLYMPESDGFAFKKNWSMFCRLETPSAPVGLRDDPCGLLEITAVLDSCTLGLRTSFGTGTDTTPFDYQLVSRGKVIRSVIYCHCVPDGLPARLEHSTCLQSLQVLEPHVTHQCTSISIVATCLALSLERYLIFSAWTLPEILDMVENVSHCFIICRP